MAKAGDLVSEAFWSKDPSDEEQSVVFVPGLLMEGNARPESKVKSCKIQEVRAKLPLHSDSVFVNPLKTRSVKLPMPNKVMEENEGTNSASLKDLCPEDKRRIANLIKELARVSEEKEETVERLKAEQESFEKKIRELEVQNEFIATEREALQQQYKKCQELLSVYQNYLSEQKEKLNQSMPEYSNTKQKVSSKKNPPQLTSSGLDGSYLGILPTCTSNAVGKSKHVLVGASLAPHLQCDLGQYFPNHNLLNQVQHADSFPSQNGCETKTGNTIQGEPVAGRCYNVNDRVDVGAVQAGTFHDTFDTDDCQPSYYGWVRKGEPDDENHFTNVHNRHFRPLIEHNAFSGMFHDPAMNNQMGIMTGEVLHEKKIPVDQKQQLLCQKMELELEKERLQRMLAQQESLLLLKQQQLHDSRLDYSRFKYHLSEAEDMTYGEGLTNKTRISVPNSARLTESYEASLVHLVDALSPISSQEHNSHIREAFSKPRKSNITHCGNHQKLAKTGTAPIRSRDSDEELEESRMLEDIFFI
uniref:protein hinderin isoform X3 n=1 Tax=Pristiophorus japonicus TaxID=55135 RepID=UPI00398F4B61